MRIASNPLKSCLLILPLALATTVPAWGQESRRASTARSLEIEVLEPGTGAVRAALRPGDTLNLESGESVDLRLKGLLPGNGASYPNTRFRVVSRGADLELRPVGDERGRWTRLTASKDARLSQSQDVVVSFKAKGLRVGERATPAEGRFTVRIHPPKAEVRITGYTIESFDVETGAQQGTIATGDVLEIDSSRAVQLRLVAQTSDGESFYPAARFFVEEGEGFLTASSRDRKTGATTVRVLDDAGAAPEALSLVFGLLDEHTFASGVKRHGLVEVRVLNGSGATSPGVLATVLYNSILLRDPEPSSHADLRDRIASGGLKAVIDAAIEIASSSESRRLTTERRATDRDRLVAVYDGLLGIGQEDAQPAEWTQHASLISRARIDLVVEDLVKDARFRQHHGFEESPLAGVRRRR